MRKAAYRFCFIALLVWARSPLVLPACLAQGQTSPQPTAPFSTAQGSLKRFLQNYLRVKAMDEDKTTRYFAAFFDLNGDGIQEAIVYITGHGWCGTGGCHTLILARDGGSWRVVAKTT